MAAEAEATREAKAKVCQTIGTKFVGLRTQLLHDVKNRTDTLRVALLTRHC
jgi:hypothetical protein